MPQAARGSLFLVEEGTKRDRSDKRESERRGEWNWDRGVQKVLVRTQVEGAGQQKNGEDLESRNLSTKQSATVLAENYKATLNTVRADRVKTEQGRILTDRSDSQIAEDPESDSTAQGC